MVTKTHELTRPEGLDRPWRGCVRRGWGMCFPGNVFAVFSRTCSSRVRECSLDTFYRAVTRFVFRNILVLHSTDLSISIPHSFSPFSLGVQDSLLLQHHTSINALMNQSPFGPLRL